MKAEIIEKGKTKKYEYISLLVADSKLTAFDLVHKWNYGVDCKKLGSAISILLRRKVI